MARFLHILKVAVVGSVGPHFRHWYTRKRPTSCEAGRFRRSLLVGCGEARSFRGNITSVRHETRSSFPSGKC